MKTLKERFEEIVASRDEFVLIYEQLKDFAPMYFQTVDYDEPIVAFEYLAQDMIFDETYDGDESQVDEQAEMFRDDFLYFIESNNPGKKNLKDDLIELCREYSRLKKECSNA